MKTYGAVLLAALLLTGCGPDDDTIFFDGQFYRAKAKKDGERHQFRATARPVSASIEGAREAARYEAITYCVVNYGSSDIIWETDPDVPAEELQVADDTLTLTGSCPL
ncbi:hypothetical protein [uncultured Roseobacter sp.]|uniref:hypothetical protein n=1 Tax=uncultured Roseobacter sp. TaxID=114847 RepID=UPI00261974B0|nr:hypothetical protein [uncultured Roseobacter sp.]